MNGCIIERNIFKLQEQQASFNGDTGFCNIFRISLKDIKQVKENEAFDACDTWNTCYLLGIYTGLFQDR